jgi:hypothetical protein
MITAKVSDIISKVNRKIANSEDKTTRIKGSDDRYFLYFGMVNHSRLIIIIDNLPRTLRVLI